MTAMTEQVTRIPLKDVLVGRVVCKSKGCGGVVEFPLDKLAMAFQNGLQCSFCREPTKMPKSDDALVRLVNAMNDIRLVETTLEVEFVLKGSPIPPVEKT